MRKATAFDTFHPIIALLYFAVVLIFCMAAFHPAYLLCSLIAGLIWNIKLKGIDAIHSLTWQLPLLVIIALLNPLFSAMGSTLLFTIFDQPLYLESLIYGLCMGTMLVAVLVWFSNASQVLSSSNIMSVFGKHMPLTGLMTTMTMRLVPKTIAQGQEISSALQACSAARTQNQENSSAQSTKKQRLSSTLRQITTLMGWTMEDSLETADSMRARGWGVTTKRTTYQQQCFTASDGVALTALVAFIVLNGFFAIQACSGFAFYPAIHGDILPIGLLAYLVLIAFPLLLIAARRN